MGFFRLIRNFCHRVKGFSVKTKGKREKEFPLHRSAFWKTAVNYNRSGLGVWEARGVDKTPLL